MFRWNPGVGQGAFRDFTEHIRFREFLGTDYDIGSSGRRSNQEGRKAGKNQEKIWNPGNQG
jgi:hypothetical protein